ncbi:hypothetical protein OH807_38320 [Kitasatospora sp. NBC_01560]|uniref:hypothetical protein n=1 Tax=Kitasatospora sp. NBC_01560 TaxID=2975965 RepID=UPI00386DE16A
MPARYVPLLRDFPGSTLTLVSTAREEAEHRHLAARLAGATTADLTVERFPQLTGDELAALGEATSPANAACCWPSCTTEAPTRTSSRSPTQSAPAAVRP